MYPSLRCSSRCTDRQRVPNHKCEKHTTQPKHPKQVSRSCGQRTPLGAIFLSFFHSWLVICCSIAHIVLMAGHLHLNCTQIPTLTSIMMLLTSINACTSWIAHTACRIAHTAFTNGNPYCMSMHVNHSLPPHVCAFHA